ncbi:MAG: transcriptional regulator, partial [Betaproteobacteria bacterium]
TDKPTKSLHRMLSEGGNPSRDNLAVIFNTVRMTLSLKRPTKTAKAA